MFDVDQLNRIIDIKWNRDNVVTIEVAVEDTSSNRVSVQTNQEVKKSSSVTDYDRLFMVFLGEDFLRKVEGIMCPLVVAEVREIF